MTITHVGTVLDELFTSPETAYLPAVLISRIVVPPVIAADDVVLVAGTFQGRLETGLASAPGWLPLVPPTESTFYGPRYKSSTPQGGTWSVAQGLTGVWWRRWADGDPTTLYGSYVPGWPPSVLTAWRGVRGFRDLASLLTPQAVFQPLPIQWPAVAAGAGDVAVMLGAWATSVATAEVASTTPATTVRGSRARTLDQVAALSDARASAGTTPAYAATGSGWPARLLTVSLCEAIAPLAPTLGSPAPSTVADLSGGATFSWTHRPAGYQGSASGAQSGYALRRRVGVGAYEYWDAGTASWKPAVVWNNSIVGAVTFPSGAWAPETDYAWSVATREDAGAQQGPFAPDRVLTVRTRPVVTVTAPDVVVTTPQPTISWTTTLTTPWEAIAYQVSIFTAAQADAPGFDPEAVTPVWTSGQYASTATSVVPWIPLTSGTTYAVMVRVQQTGAQWAEWARADTLVSLAAPARPSVSAVASTDPASGCPTITVTVASRNNLIAAADASIEAPNSWTAGPNTDLVTVSTWAADGAKSLQLTAVAGGEVSSVLGALLPVEPGAVYTATATVHAAATPRPVIVTILWQDAAGASLGSSPSVAAPDATGSAGVLVEFAATAPAGAAAARMQVTVTGCAAAEVHHADRFGLAPGADTLWSPGGFTDVTTTIEYADDPLSGTWGTLATIPLDTTATITDWTPQPGQLRSYRARTNASTYASAPSAPAVAGIDIDTYWLIDVDAGTAVECLITADDQRVHPRDRGEFTAFGREVTQVRSGDKRTARGAFVARCWTAADTGRLIDLLNGGRTLLVQAPRESGIYPQHLYFAVVGDDAQEARATPGYPSAERLVSWSWRADSPPVGESFGGRYPVGYAGTL